MPRRFHTPPRAAKLANLDVRVSPDFLEALNNAVIASGEEDRSTFVRKRLAIAIQEVGSEHETVSLQLSESVQAALLSGGAEMGHKNAGDFITALLKKLALRSPQEIEAIFNGAPVLERKRIQEELEQVEAADTERRKERERG